MNLVESVNFIVSAAHKSCFAREASVRQEFTVLQHSSVNGNELKCKVKRPVRAVVFKDTIN